MRFFIAVAAAALLEGCSGHCQDCGPCGLIGVANTGPTLNAMAGIGPKRELRVELRAGAMNECGTPAPPAWIDANGVVTEHTNDEHLDYSVMSTGGVVTHGGTTLTISRGADRVKLDFRADAGTLTRTCLTVDGHTVQCH